MSKWKFPEWGMLGVFIFMMAWLGFEIYMTVNPEKDWRFKACNYCGIILNTKFYGQTIKTRDGNYLFMCGNCVYKIADKVLGPRTDE